MDDRRVWLCAQRIRVCELGWARVRVMLDHSNTEQEKLLVFREQDPMAKENTALCMRRGLKLLAWTSLVKWGLRGKKRI